MIAQQTKSPQGVELLPVYLFAGLFVALALGAAGIVVTNISSVFGAMTDGDTFGQALLRFLNTYGIILPVILLGLAVFFVVIAARLFQRDVKAANWARQLLLWMLVAAIVLIIQAFTAGLTGTEDIPGSLGDGLNLALPWILVAAVLAGALWWLNQSTGLFVGMETLSETSGRVAWNLLLPTILLLVVVALRPLETTFIASLTNREFARTSEIEFVGLDNYARLLGIRFDVVPCERGDDGACVLDDTGVTVFPRARDYLDEGYTELRYREVNTWTVGESQVVISARDRDFVSAIGNTLYFTIVSVTLELVLGLFIAMVINSKFSGRGLMRAAMLVPWAIPTAVSSRLWEIMLRDNQSGVINAFLVNAGLLQSSQAWLANSALQIPALIAVDVWKTTPFMALILLAGLQVISGDLYEAASVDGASRVRQFFSITLPLLRPAIAVALVFRTLDAVRVFDVFQILLGRQQLSMATYNYETLIQAQQLGYASAIGVVIFVIILIFAIIYMRILGVETE